MVFVISVLNSLLLGKDKEYLPFQGIVLAHTRELAHQIHREFKRMGKYFRRPELRFACVFGGISVEDNIRELTRVDKLPHIVIGTPGRMLDLNQKKVLHLDLVIFFLYSVSSLWLTSAIRLCRVLHSVIY
jgi:superfamily II DNA/RNA helicase